MGLMNRLAALAGYERRDDASPRDPSWQALSAGSGYHGALSARAAENLSAVLACTNAIATALAYVPALVYRREGDNRIEHPSHPLSRLSRGQIAARLTWPDTLEHWISSALLTGNGLLEINRDGRGQVAGLGFIPWQHVTVQELASGRLAYDVGDGKGKVRRLLEGEVLHLRDRTDDGLIGRSRLSRAAETVSGVSASNTFARSFLEKGAAPSGILKFDGHISPQQVSDLRQQMRERNEGAANAGRVMILDGGMEWVATQISPEDAELLESRKFGVIEICRLYGVPPPIVQAYENNTFTNAAQAGLWFATFCLAPWARKIEAEFARSLFPAGGPYELELDLSGFLRGDPKTRWDAHKIAIDTGVLDPEEVRQVEGWNPRKVVEGKAGTEAAAE